MVISPSEAAQRVGKSKAGIIKSIHQGKLMAHKDPSGVWRIDTDDLERVYPLVSTNGYHDGECPSTTSTIDTRVDAGAHTIHTVSADGVQGVIEQLKARLVDKDDVIADLRRRLDRAGQVEWSERWWERLIGAIFGMVALGSIFFAMWVIVLGL